MIRTLDPLSDPRWRELVQRDPRASAFHTPGWLEALRRTYGFVPVVYTTAGPRDELRSAIPFCGVTSWLTGRRLVSLPFSDHCEPLVDDPAALVEILDQVAGDAQRNGCRYIQVRPRSEVGAAGTAMFQREEMNYLYALDLRPDLDSLWRGINRNNHRGIRRAELGTWRRIVGRDARFVRAYFALHVMTRSMLGVPPQPLAWFQNLVQCLGDLIEIQLLLKDDTPVAGLVTILFRDELVWKYSGADRVRNRDGMKLLMWKSVQRAKEQGATSLDLGRCESAHVGLAEFKEAWGARRATLNYLRYPALTADRPGRRPRVPWLAEAAKSVVPRLPTSLLTMAGRLAYRHVA